MAHTTINPDDAMQEDMKNAREQTGVSTTHLLTTLYRAWRKGEIQLSSLPDGSQVNGPLDNS